MNYKLTNFEIREAKGNRISGQDSNNQYLYATAFNPMNRFEKSHNIVIFDAGTVEYYRQRLPLSKGGLLPDENWNEANMDAHDKIFVNGCMCEYDLGALYCRKYTNDIVDENGITIPGKEAGKIICDLNGNPIVFNSIMVFCQYSFKTEALFDDFGMPIIDEKTGNPKMKIVRDQNGNPIEQWVDGWAPNQVGESMRRLLTPYTGVATQAAGETTQGDVVETRESPNIFGDNPAQQQTPAQQTPAQQQ